MMNTTPPPPPSTGKDTRVRCALCAHYYITHDVCFPYACRALAFKSRIEPCREVFDASGEPCAYFEDKRQSKLAR